MDKRELSLAGRKALLQILQERFANNCQRHTAVKWEQVQVRLLKDPAKLYSLNAMEMSGGEPDLVGFSAKTGAYIFCDCAAESPQGRRSLCYDRAGLEARQTNKPENSALDLTAAMGVELLTEAEYRRLQSMGEFDLQTSSWVKTPAAIRKQGGALFCDRRYDTVFVYHNAAETYYAARGFRARLEV